jgi:hypothetical protein
MRGFIPSLFIVLFLISIPSFAQTFVSGDINADETWDAGGSPYILTGDVHINLEAVLTIDPDVEVQLSTFAIRVDYNLGGTMNGANVTFNGPGEVRYNSVGHGSLLGCTFVDGTLTLWGDPEFDTCSMTNNPITANGSSQFTGCVMTTSDLNVGGNGNTFTSCTISGSWYGIELTGQNASFDACTLTGNHFPMHVYAGSTFEDNGTDWTGNEVNLIHVGGHALNDWIFPENVAGTPFQLYGTLYVSNGAVLTMNGVTLNLGGYSFRIGYTGGGTLHAYNSTIIGGGSLMFEGSDKSTVVECELENVYVQVYGEASFIGSSFDGPCDFWLHYGQLAFFKACNFDQATTLSGNNSYAIHAEDCWWGHTTGPTHPGNPSGLGTSVTNNVDYAPWRATPYDEALVPVIFAMIPTENGIIIPGGVGGSFSFDLLIVSNIPENRTGQMWIEAILPSGFPYAVSNQNVTVPGDQMIHVVDQVQDVPAIAPVGNYIYRAKVGIYPNYVVDSEEFGFSVSP